MQTPAFKLKSLRTLGISLACGALIAGCAGNSVKSMDQQTGPVSSSQVSSEPVANNDGSLSNQTTAKTTAPDLADKSQAVVPASVASGQPDKADTPVESADATTRPPVQTASVTQEPSQTTFYFGINKTSLDEQDKDALKDHARFLKANPGLVLEINGHTDSTGPHAYNEYLSKQRAEAVARILINEGVTRSQLVINALADSKPLQNPSDPGKNRRVDLQYDDMSMVSSK